MKPAVVTNPIVLDGAPCFSGTRVPFQTLLDYVTAGHPLGDFLADHPGITHDAAVSALQRAGELLCLDAASRPRQARGATRELPPVPARSTRAGRTVTLASTAGVDALRDTATEFMSTVFDLDAGEYLITDESDLLDFTPLDRRDASEAWRKIGEAYGLCPKSIGSSRLLPILQAIASPGSRRSA